MPESNNIAMDVIGAAINNEYKYSHEDIRIILEHRLREYQNISLHKFRKNTQIIVSQECAEPESLKKSLINEQLKSNNDARILLIPYQINNDHWVGVLIELERGSKISYAKYISSLSSNGNPKDLSLELKYLKTASKYIYDIYAKDDKDDIANNARYAVNYTASSAVNPTEILQIMYLLESPDEYSSCVYVIENLLRAALRQNKTNPPTVQGFRTLHAEIINMHKPENAPKFYKVPVVESQASFLKINPTYEYESKDIQEILLSRLEKAESETPQNFEKPVKVMGCVNNYNPGILGTILNLEYTENLKKAIVSFIEE